MKFKIPFNEENHSGVQPYFISDKSLLDSEKEEKNKCLDTLCKLIKLKEFGYRDKHGNSLISIKKDNNGIIVEMVDKNIKLEGGEDEF